MTVNFKSIFMEITVLFRSIYYRIKECVADSFAMAIAQMVLISLYL